MALTTWYISTNNTFEQWRLVKNQFQSNYFQSSSTVVQQPQWFAPCSAEVFQLIPAVLNRLDAWCYFTADVTHSCDTGSDYGIPVFIQYNNYDNNVSKHVVDNGNRLRLFHVWCVHMCACARVCVCVHACICACMYACICAVQCYMCLHALGVSAYFYFSVTPYGG